MAVLAASLGAIGAMALGTVAFRSGGSETVRVVEQPVGAETTSTSAMAGTTVVPLIAPTLIPKITTSTVRATAKVTTTTIPRATALRRVLVGDSITADYGPLVVGATVLGGPGQDAATHPWEVALRAGGPADIVVLQDYVIPGTVGPRDAWVRAWTSLVAAAHSLAPTVVILVGGPESVFEASLPAEHVWLPAADSPDGIHFTPAGSAGLAAIVAALR